MASCHSVNMLLSRGRPSLGQLLSANTRTFSTFNPVCARVRRTIPPRKYPTPPPTNDGTNNFNFTPPPNRDTKGPKIRSYTPRTPGLRHLRRPINDHLWKGGPFKPLTIARKGHGIGGRNNTGRVTVRHRGGGHKRRIRTVDFHRMEPGPHTVERIERDPGRSGHIALVNNDFTGRKSYILASDGLRAGDVVHSYRTGIPEDLLASMGGVIDPGMLAAKTAWRGNCMPLHMIPVGTVIHALGTKPGSKAKYCRAAGTYATIISKEEDNEALREKATKKSLSGKKLDIDMKKLMVIVRLQSGEVRRLARDAPATVGVVSNPNWQDRQLGKAGRSRWLGIRPTVRGVAMNACDHPHGGGRGKSKGHVHPMSPWGVPTKSGYKTRNKGNPNKWVVTPRPRNNGARRNKN